MKLWGYQNGDDYFYFGDEETKALKGKVACLEPHSSLEGKTKALSLFSSSSDHFNPLQHLFSYNSSIRSQIKYPASLPHNCSRCIVFRLGEKKGNMWSIWKKNSLYSEVGQFILSVIFWLENEVDSALRSQTYWKTWILYLIWPV